MRNIQTKLLQLRLSAFTLLESLLTLSLLTFFAISLSGSIHSVFRQAEELLFFLRFEHLYTDSQRLAVTSQQPVSLTIQSRAISNGYQSVELPQSVSLEKDVHLTFDQEGGNSSLAKVQFQTEDKSIAYQLYLGSGRYKKTAN